MYNLDKQNSSIVMHTINNLNETSYFPTRRTPVIKKLSLNFNHSIKRRKELWQKKKENLVERFSCHEDFNYTDGLIVHVISAGSEG